MLALRLVRRSPTEIASPNTHAANYITIAIRCPEGKYRNLYSAPPFVGRVPSRGGDLARRTPVPFIRPIRPILSPYRCHATNVAQSVIPSLPRKPSGLVEGSLSYYTPQHGEENDFSGTQ